MDVRQTDETTTGTVQLARCLSVPSLMPGSKTNTTYKLGAYLGKGGFASCYTARDSTSGASFALKIIPKQGLTKPYQIRKVMREISLHYNLRHKNVVQMFSAFDDTDNIYMVLELCAKQSMLHLLRSKANGRLDERSTRHFMRQLIDGVRYLHNDAKILHRDLKLGNLLLCESPGAEFSGAVVDDDERLVLKIADFGLAMSFGASVNGDSVVDVSGGVESADENRIALCGTPNYIAPEILKHMGNSIATESWAVGCIMFAMLFGKPPFETHCADLTYNLIGLCRYNLFENKEKSSQQVDLDFSRVSYAARHLIAQFLQPDPNFRPKFDPLLLTHAFFRPDLYFASKLEPAYNLEASEISKLAFMCAPCDAYSNPDRGVVKPEPPAMTMPSYSSSGDSGFSPDTPRRQASLFAVDVAAAAVVGRSALSSASNSSPPSPNEQFASSGCGVATADGYFLPPDFFTDDVVAVSSTTLPSTASCNTRRRVFTRHLGELLGDVCAKLTACLSPSSSPNNATPFAGDYGVAPTHFFYGTRAEKSANGELLPPPVAAPFVSKWIDYSNRHGLGLVYRDGTACVKFKDGWSVFMDVKCRRYARVITPWSFVASAEQTYSNPQSDAYGNPPSKNYGNPFLSGYGKPAIDGHGKIATIRNYSNPGGELNRKPTATLDGGGTEVIVDLSAPLEDVGLLERLQTALYFADYMDTNLVDAFLGFFTNDPHSASSPPCRSVMCKVPYLFYWRRFEDHIVFLFSDGTFQVNFTDNHVKIAVRPIRRRQRLPSATASVPSAIPTSSSDYSLSFVDRLGGRWALDESLPSLFAAATSEIAVVGGGAAAADAAYRPFFGAIVRRVAESARRLGERLVAV